MIYFITRNLFANCAVNYLAKINERVNICML